MPSFPAGDAWSRDRIQAFDLHLRHLGIPPLVMMEQAARGLTESVLERLPSLLGGDPPLDLLVLVGPGNNGADGVALARQLLGHPRVQPRLWLLQPSVAPESALAQQIAVYQGLGGELTSGPAHPAWPTGPGLLVDALLGVGLDRPLRDPIPALLEAAESTGLPVLAVDQPTGLDADEGTILGAALPATWTVSFVAPRPGFRHGEGPRLCGEVETAQLGVRPELAAAWAAAQG